MSKEYVAYYRVSTAKQGKSGLGLAAQKETVEKQAARDGGKIIKEFVEVESGKTKKRPELWKAITEARAKGAALIVAKLDRLGRKMKHLTEIRESGIDLVACDLPGMDTMSFGIFATFAQAEGERISERTKEALQEKKKQGVKLGSPQNLTDKARKKAYRVRRKNAQENPDNLKAAKIARDLRAQGLSYHKVADKLNDYGLKTRTGKQFYGMSVKNLIELYGTLIAI